MPPSTRKRTAQAVLSSAFIKQPQHADAAATTAVSHVSLSLHHHSSNSNDMELFHAWRHHTSLQFHAFQDAQEVTEIRQALLLWYHQHRRKLPWRGDPSPWTGSTVDFVTNSSRNRNQKKTNKQQIKQTALTSFFGSSSQSTTTTTKSTTAATTEEERSVNDTIESNDTQIFPITPYGVWVSEIMLQQTRVEAVIPYWVKWMQSFPTIFDLAAATPEQVNAHWAGLGFYRRARFLHAGAQMVVAQYSVSSTAEEDTNIDTTTTRIIAWPTTVEAWQQLPGIGRYTASAICSICFQQNVPVVDGNVCRVLSRLRGVAQHVKAPVFKDQYAWSLLQPLLDDTDEPGNVNQALMELGATYCAPSGTGMEEGDPLRDFYWSTRLVSSAMEWNGTADTTTPLVASSSILREATTNSKCPLCAVDGVEQVIQQWRECPIIPNLRVYGHQYLPMAPPQSAKRVQVWHVAVLVRRDNDDDDDNRDKQRWLLVQRPPTGLLAGQWEFPCICLWDSADETKVAVGMPKKKMKPTISPQKVVDPEPPTIPLAKKRNAWTSLLQTLSVKDKTVVISSSSVSNECLEHVFSHVKHIMYLQTGQVVAEKDKNDESSSFLSTTTTSTTTDGRAMRWMNADDMKQVGITSGVKKILKAMEHFNA